MYDQTVMTITCIADQLLLMTVEPELVQQGLEAVSHWYLTLSEPVPVNGHTKPILYNSSWVSECCLVSLTCELTRINFDVHLTT